MIKAASRKRRTVLYCFAMTAALIMLISAQQLRAETGSGETDMIPGQTSDQALAETGRTDAAAEKADGLNNDSGAGSTTSPVTGLPALDTDSESASESKTEESEREETIPESIEDSGEDPCGQELPSIPAGTETSSPEESGDEPEGSTEGPGVEEASVQVPQTIRKQSDSFIEKDPPLLTISIDGKSPDQSETAALAETPLKKHSFTWTADDTRGENGEKREAFSGIRRVSWMLRKRIREDRLETVRDFQEQVLYLASDEPASQQEAMKYGTAASEGPVEINAAESGLSGVYRLIIKAEDFCGNTSEWTADLFFDGIAPEAVISAGGTEGILTGAGVEYCYNAKTWKNESITVRDEAGIRSVEVKAENTGTGKRKTWIFPSQGEGGTEISSDEKKTTVKVSLDSAASLGEGRITFTVHSVDEAGNETTEMVADPDRREILLAEEAEGKSSALIFYDNTPPDLHVQMREGQLYRENWYYRKANCGIRIEIEDNICPVKSYWIELRNDKEGTTIRKRTVPGSQGEDETRAVTELPGRNKRSEPYLCARIVELTLSPDEVTAIKAGRIRVYMEAEDGAGNRMNLFGSDESEGSIALFREGKPVEAEGKYGDEAAFVLDLSGPSVSAEMMQEGRKFTEKAVRYYYRADNCGLRIRIRDEDDDGGICACRISVQNEKNGKGLLQEIRRTDTLQDEKQIRRVPGQAEITDPYTISDEIEVEFSRKEVGILEDGPISILIRAEDPAGNITKNLDRGIGMTLKAGAEGSNEGSFVLDMTAPMITCIRTDGEARGAEAEGVGNRAPYDDGEGPFYYYNEDTISTVFTVEEENPDLMWTSCRRDGVLVENVHDPAGKAGSGISEGNQNKSVDVICSYGKGDLDRTPEGRYSGITIRGTDRAGNPLRLRRDENEKIMYAYTGKGFNDVDRAVEEADNNGIGAITLVNGKVVDRTAPVAELSYSTPADLWLYKGITTLDGEVETDAENYSIATAYLNKEFTASVRISDLYGTAEGSHETALDPVKLTAEQFGWIHVKADSSKGMKKDGSFQWTFQAGSGSNQQFDGAYYYKVYGTDRAGNAMTVRESFRTGARLHRIPVEPVYETCACDETYHAKYRLVLDTVSPQFTFYMADPGAGETTDGETAYYGSRTTELEGTFAIVDMHLDPDRLRTGAAFREENRITHYDKTELLWSEVNFDGPGLQKSGKAFSGKVRISGEGICRFAICGTDKAGNPILQSPEEKNKTGFRATSFAGTRENDSRGKAIAKGDGTEMESGISTQSGGFWTCNKVLDKTAPTGILEIGNGKTCYYHVDMGEDGVNILAEGGNRYAPYRKEKKATVSIQASDLSPVRMTWRILSSVEGKNKSNMDGEYLNDNRQTAGVTGEQIFHVSGLTLTDRAGNRSGFIKEAHTEANNIYLDVTPPVNEDLDRPFAVIRADGKITKSNADGRDLFNRGIDLKVSVTDPNENVRSAGLEHVTILVRADGKKVLQQTISGTKSIDGRRFHTGRAPLYKVQTLDHSFEKTLHLAAGGIYETNNIEVEVTAADNAGNKADTVTYRCGIDTKGPVIRVRYDNNKALNDLYFNAARHATIEVEDRNVDGNKIHISTQAESGGGFRNIRHAGNGGNDLWQKVISYTEDGDYTLEIKGTDALGNRAEVFYEGTAPNKFTIDTTPPRAVILFDVKEGYHHSRFFSRARTGTVEITDRNFRPQDAKILTKGSLRTPDGITEVPPAEGRWSRSGDRSKKEYRFVEDGDYSISVECVDLAGNRSEKYTADPFTVDTTRPVIQIEGDSFCGGGIYTETIAPRVRFYDNNYDPENVFFALAGTKAGSEKYLSRQEMLEDETGFGGWIHYEDLPRRRILDDIYTARGRITDRAGNTAKISLIFSVNRFGSTYDYGHDPVTESFVHGYKREGMDLVLREINVSELTSYDVYLARDTEFSRLKEGQDYLVTKIHDPDDFSGHVYLYRIFAKNFSREGHYEIVVQSVDRAGNRNSNTGVRSDDNVENAVPLSFIIDRSNPTVSLQGVDPRNLFWKQESLKVGILPEDNVRLARVNVYLDGKLVGTWLDRGEEDRLAAGEYPLSGTLEKNAGSIPFTFHQSLYPQHLFVEAVDMAGNKSTRLEEVIDWSPVVHGSALVQYYNRKHLFYGSMILVVILLAVITAGLYRRYREGQTGQAGQYTDE